MQENNVYNGNINLINRKTLSMTNIISVDAFSENLLKLSCGNSKVLILGKNLKITAFNNSTGVFNAEGLIDEIKFNATKTSFIKRLFK